MLLFTADSDLGYCRLIVADEKFISGLPQNQMPWPVVPHW